MRAAFQRRPSFPFDRGHRCALPFRSHWERPGEGSSPKAAMFPVRVWPSSSLRFLSLWERLGEGGSPKAAKFPLRAWPSLCSPVPLPLGEARSGQLAEGGQDIRSNLATYDPPSSTCSLFRAARHTLPPPASLRRNWLGPEWLLPRRPATIDRITSLRTLYGEHAPCSPNATCPGAATIKERPGLRLHAHQSRPLFLLRQNLHDKRRAL